uniref:Uncharacterized protein n=1 Tax=Anguilla anguilla TaxID=7936 RepID=A0A0E9VZX5_ANGAN
MHSMVQQSPVLQPSRTQSLIF